MISGIGEAMKDIWKKDKKDSQIKNGLRGLNKEKIFKCTDINRKV